MYAILDIIFPPFHLISHLSQRCSVMQCPLGNKCCLCTSSQNDHWKRNGLQRFLFNLDGMITCTFLSLFLNHYQVCITLVILTASEFQLGDLEPQVNGFDSSKKWLLGRDLFFWKISGWRLRNFKLLLKRKWLVDSPTFGSIPVQIWLPSASPQHWKCSQAVPTEKKKKGLSRIRQLALL